MLHWVNLTILHVLITANFLLHCIVLLAKYGSFRNSFMLIPSFTAFSSWPTYTFDNNSRFKLSYLQHPRSVMGLLPYCSTQDEHEMNNILNYIYGCIIEPNRLLLN
ncbi:hypothetical protein K450DRAFT_243784 [Umbelopsis ramanniana AG]|uniref:Uncharacterized protein n=1 Tax=Umbelopsis ramanniana AG TaxID=1314678 RepID=A0AAD5E854_UMBRA|nr:uncharacterized protein K450DRAFT_243784 [Umbelopsis ramanniana AG]KAI8579081.1 hypothetical protein K450DRAFT_243784 [Umbelopsis ramanniana AG]